MYIRKDCPEEQTIKNILNYIESKDIIIWETHRKENKYFSSCRIELAKLPGIGTNGKGCTYLQAKASALGELMERIQGGYILRHLFRFCDNVSENSDDIDIFSAYLYKYNGFCDQYEELLKNCKILKCGVCTNMFTNEKIFYPKGVIEALNGSNGLCAGNSFEDAVSQGIAELFERYVLKKIYFNNDVYIYDITESVIRTHAQIRNIINMLKEKGLVISILDCSLGCSLPVLGLFITNKENTRYKFSLGCDLDFIIAFQRCITEIFQGYGIGADFKFSMNYFCECDLKLSANSSKHKYMQYIKSLQDWSGTVPIPILTKKVKTDFDYAPYRKSKSNKQMYKYYLYLCKKHGWELLIEDNTLGFPAYRVIIPQISQVKAVEDIIATEDYLNKLHKAIIVFLTEGSNELQLCTILEKLHDVYGNITLYQLYGIALLKICEVGLIDYIIWLNYELRNYSRAIEYIDILLAYNKNRNDLFILKTIIKNRGCLPSMLQYMLPTDIDITKYLTNWNTFLKDSIPFCPYCNNCKIKNICNKKEYERIQMMF